MGEKDPVPAGGEGLEGDERDQDSQIPMQRLSGVAALVREIETLRVTDDRDTEGQAILDGFARERRANQSAGFSIPNHFL